MFTGIPHQIMRNLLMVDILPLSTYRLKLLATDVNECIKHIDPLYMNDTSFIKTMII